MTMTPIAQSLAAQGRNGDSMLVHMTPNEVGGLQALAQNMGGSLTTNPTTGLPEANFLEAILPTIIGLGVTAATGGAAAPWMIGAGVGGGTALLTGDLNRGLMAGLGAFGGAGLGSTLMGMGSASQALTTAPSAAIGPPTAATPSTLSTLGAGAKSAMANPGAFGSQLVSNLGGPFGAGAAGLGLLGSMDAASQTNVARPTVSAQGSSSYEGPYMPPERQARFPQERRKETSEFDFFSPSNPVPGYRRFADGGMAEGFQTFGGRSATDNLYAFDPDDRRFRNELEKIRILGRQTAAGIPMNVSGIDQRGEPIYEQSYTFDIPQLTDDDIGAVRGALGITDLQNQISNIPQPLTFRDMTDQDMDYLKSVLDIRPSPETVVNPPSPSGPPEFRPPASTPTTTAPATTAPVSTAEKIHPEVQPPPPPAPPPAPPPTPTPGYTPLEQRIIETQAAGQDPWQLQSMQGTVFEDAMFGGGSSGLPRGVQIAPLTQEQQRAAVAASRQGQPLPERHVTIMETVDFGDNPQNVARTIPLSEFDAHHRARFEHEQMERDRLSMQAAAGGVIRKAAGGLAALASGGELLEDGSFVIDARTVAELGNGSSNAGIELLMQLGGRPVEGPGDGVSDSVPAMIEGGQPAAVARDEVIFDPEAVARLGEGDHQRGSQRLYELMRMAEEARKEVDRGEPSGAGLEALSMAGAGAV